MVKFHLTKLAVSNPNEDSYYFIGLIRYQSVTVNFQDPNPIKELSSDRIAAGSLSECLINLL